MCLLYVILFYIYIHFKTTTMAIIKFKLNFSNSNKTKPKYTDRLTAIQKKTSVADNITTQLLLVLMMCKTSCSI